MATKRKNIAPQDARSRILAAGLEAFSSIGFEGASLRQIATLADVQHQLVVYHFKTKDILWREVISFVLEKNEQTREPSYWIDKLKHEEPASVLGDMVHALVAFTAQYPEFTRLVTFEGQTDSERLRWLLKTHVRPYYKLFTNTIMVAQKAGVARAGDPGQLFYALIGLVTMGLVSAHEYRIMTGKDPSSPKEIEKLIDLAYDVLCPGHAIPKGVGDSHMDR